MCGYSQQTVLASTGYRLIESSEGKYLLETGCTMFGYINIRTLGCTEDCKMLVQVQ